MPASTPPYDISAMVPDWGRERCTRVWDPGRRLLLSIRRYQAWRHRGIVALSQGSFGPANITFGAPVTGADIPLTCHIAGGLLIPHPNGIVIHPDAVIGPNCLLFQQVTVGTGGPIAGLPILGGHVDVGAARRSSAGSASAIMGEFGANAVVIDHVPEGATAVGVPARNILADQQRRVRPKSRFMPTSSNRRRSFFRFRIGSRRQVPAQRVERHREPNKGQWLCHRSQNGRRDGTPRQLTAAAGDIDATALPDRRGHIPFE